MQLASTIFCILVILLGSVVARPPASRKELHVPTKAVYPPWYARGIGQLNGRTWNGFQWEFGYPPGFGRFYVGTPGVGSDQGSEDGGSDDSH